MGFILGVLVESSDRKRQGPVAAIKYEWPLGIWVEVNNEWKPFAERNTRPGYKLIANIAETCEMTNTKFSVYLREPQGLRALEVVLDVPSKSEKAKQRACVETGARDRVDLLEWLDSFVPRASS